MFIHEPTLLLPAHPHTPPLALDGATTEGAACRATGRACRRSAQLSIRVIYILAVDVVSASGEGAAVLSAGILLLQAVQLDLGMELGKETHG